CSGDHALVAPFPGGVLVALVDGLGHGQPASIAAKAAIEVLSQHPDHPVGELIASCHERLRTTRGAVISLASFDASRGAMTWVGVGNVEGVLVRGGGSDAMAMRGGTVGFQLPPLK